jgi:hypothetical protein
MEVIRTNDIIDEDFNNQDNFYMIDIYENEYSQDSEYKNHNKYDVVIKSIYQLNGSNKVRKHYRHIENLDEYNKFIVDYNNTFIRKITIFNNDHLLVKIINDEEYNNSSKIKKKTITTTTNFFLNDIPVDKKIFFHIIILLMIYLNKKKGFTINKTYRINRKYICYVKCWNEISKYFPTYMIHNYFIEITFYINIKNEKEIDIIITTSYTN